MHAMPPRPYRGLSHYAISLLWCVANASAATVTFQEGVNGYAGTSDTWIGSAVPSQDNSSSAVVEWDGEDAGGQNFGLLRFNAIFGTNPGQIPPGANITSATLTYVVSNPGNDSTVNEILVDWTAAVTWNTFGGTAGVQAGDYGTQVGTAPGASGTQICNVTSSLAAWSANPSANRGWIFRPTGGADGVEFASNNNSTVANRYLLTVTYTVPTAIDITPASISTVVGKANVPITVAIPASSNASTAVTVTLTTTNVAVAVPVGATGASLVLTFPAGGASQQSASIDIGQAGSATITTSNDASLTNDTLPVTVTAGAVSLAPTSLNSGNNATVPISVSVPAGSTDTRSIAVSLTTADAAVALPIGASGNTLTVNFAQGGATQQWINMQCGQVGTAAVTMINNGGLANVNLPVTVFAGFNFTASADPRGQTSSWSNAMAAIQSTITTLGAFHVSPGDIDPPQPLRDVMDARFGPSVLWYPLVGNHEIETAADMTWVRAEYNTGNGARTPLKYATNQDGPPGSVETTFSWDYGNAHFVSINQYWNGGSVAGSDVAVDGDICPELYDWLAADLAATTKPVLFVFGHEPAFPQHRHIGDSLDKYPEHRDTFWSLLQTYNVQAFICGHTHVYSRYQSTPNGTWQIDCGNDGNDTNSDGLTFINVIVTATQVTFETWRNKPGSWQKTETWSVPVGPRLTVSPTSLTRQVRIGRPLSSDVFTVGMIGGTSNHSITVDNNPTWLTVSPTSGASGGGVPVSHTVTYSTAALAIDQYSATIRITDSAAVNNPQTLVVTLDVTSVKPDFDADNDVDQTDFGHLQKCLSGQMIAQTDPACATAIFDGDGDVDEDELAVFLLCLGGPNQPIPVTCP